MSWPDWGQGRNWSQPELYRSSVFFNIQTWIEPNAVHASWSRVGAALPHSRHHGYSLSAYPDSRCLECKQLWGGIVLHIDIKPYYYTHTELELHPRNYYSNTEFTRLCSHTSWKDLTFSQNSACVVGLCCFLSEVWWVEWSTGHLWKTKSGAEENPLDW